MTILVWAVQVISFPQASNNEHSLTTLDTPQLYHRPRVLGKTQDFYFPLGQLSCEDSSGTTESPTQGQCLSACPEVTPHFQVPNPTTAQAPSRAG